MKDTMKLNRMKEGMSFAECLTAITGDDLYLNLTVPVICETMALMCRVKNFVYGFLMSLDEMEIYGDDLLRLYKDFCGSDSKKLLAITLAYEVGRARNRINAAVPEFAKLEKVKHILSKLRQGKKASFPFDEAKHFIEKNSLYRF